MSWLAVDGNYLIKVTPTSVTPASIMPLIEIYEELVKPESLKQMQ